MFDNSIHQNEPLIQAILYDFDRQMTFGTWLKQKRSDARVSGPDFERGGVSRQYISNLETGHVERPSREYAVKIAKVLKIDPGEALNAAGYTSPNQTTSTKPRTLPELLDALDKLGIENVHFANHDALAHATPEELEEVRKAVEFAVEITLRKHIPSKHEAGGFRLRE